MSGRKGDKEEPSMSSIHSANQWESAEFDDDAQRQKFLRLMGGMKKQHTGRFVIGDTHQDAHTRTADENKELTDTLEHQYQVGLEKKLTGQNRRHVGLGFSEPEEEKEEKKKEPGQPKTHIRFDSSDEEDGDEEGGDRKKGEARDSEGKAGRDKKRKEEADGDSRGKRDEGRDAKKKQRSRDEPDDADESRTKKQKKSKRKDSDSDSD